MKGCDIMSTFMFKNKINEFTPVSNIFIDTFMPNARGEFVKVYLLGLKYCMSGEIGVNSAMLASTLHLLETDVMNAWNYWNDEGVIKIIPIDKMNNFNIEFLDLLENIDTKSENINLLRELSNNSTKDMLQDIEKLVGRPLSSKEMEMYISWLTDFNFKPEIILLLIEYCVSRSKTDYRYIEKVAITWHEANIYTLEDAQTFIKKFEDKWVTIRKILNYLGIKDMEVMKPQEQMLDKWINIYKFPFDVICKACDICFERLNRAEFKYIDGILNSWFKDGIKTLEDVATKNTKPSNYKNNTYNKSTNDTFNNYDQRTYDYDDLEKKLLGWDKND